MRCTIYPLVGYGDIFSMGMRQKDRIEWRRNKVQELQSKGYFTVDEIANKLQLPRSTMGKDIVF